MSDGNELNSGLDDGDGRFSYLAKQIKPRRLIGVIVVLLVISVTTVVLVRDGRQLLSHSFKLNPLLLFFSFIIEVCGLLLAVFVWRQMMNRFSRSLTYWGDLRIYSYSMLGIMLPGGIWTAAGRVALYKQKGIASLPVAGATVVEFIIIGLAGLLVYGLTALWLPATAVWQRPGIALTITLISLLLIQPPIFNRLSNWLLSRSRPDKPLKVKLKYLDLVRWLIMESVVVVIGGTAVYVLLKSSITDPPADIFLAVISAWAVATTAGNLFFWLPGTLFIRDGIIALILAQYIPPSMAILFVLLVRVWTIASILVLVALVWFFLEPKSPLNQRFKLTNPKIHPK